ncbi:MAG TPA: hypothetical protein V6C57_19165, partial [Coleofasciculaceae cyanobacterium]
GVSLIRDRRADSEQSGRLVDEPREHLLDEQVKRLVDAEMARSLNAFHQLLAAIEYKRRR